MSKEEYDRWQEKEQEKLWDYYRYAPEEKSITLTPNKIKEAMRLLEMAKLLDKEQQAQIKRLKGWVRFLAVWVLVIILIHTAAFIWWLA
jgi:hypothetical protein